MIGSSTGHQSTAYRPMRVPASPNTATVSAMPSSAYSSPTPDRIAEDKKRHRSRGFLYNFRVTSLLAGGLLILLLVLLVHAAVVSNSVSSAYNRPISRKSNKRERQRYLQHAAYLDRARTDGDDENAAIEALDMLLGYVKEHPVSSHVSSNLNVSAIANRLRSRVGRKYYQLAEVPLPTYVKPASLIKVPDDRGKQTNFVLEWDYLSKEKAWPYVGSGSFNGISFKNGTYPYYNSLAVFPFQNSTRMHGLVGMFPNGSRWWDAHRQPEPVPLKADTKEEEDACKRGGGFYLDLSNALPLDREPLDTRDSMCQNLRYDLAGLDDSSVIITFYNEPLSTLIRSVHSILNLTPPPLLREILIVDDHSSLEENLPGGPLDEVVRLLPKTKLLRLPTRHGLVAARLAGIAAARAPVVVILDSHIEVNHAWLEPQLQRLKESPRSVVFPQIPSIDPLNFAFLDGRGIGCQLGFKWIMQEIPDFVKHHKKPDALPSASMAGGLFAVYRDWFYEVGAYDKHFTMWGAENVEMAFRVWMCGGRVECVPCARVHHIFRHKGSGYKSPGDAVKINRLRTAALWTDEFYQLTRVLIHPTDEPIDLGSFDNMLELKERLQCKNFEWFRETLGLKDKLPKKLSDVTLLGEIRLMSDHKPAYCWDTLSNAKSPGKPWGLYPCHTQGGSQAFASFGDGAIRATTHDHCMASNSKIENCKTPVASNAVYGLDQEHQWLTQDGKCVTADIDKKEIRLMVCDPENTNQKWKWGLFEPDPNYKGVQHSSKWNSENAQWQKNLS